MKDVINFFLENNYLVNPDFIEGLPSDFEPQLFLEKLLSLKEPPYVLTREVFESLWEKKGLTTDLRLSVQVLDSYDEKPCKRETKHFVDYFKARYDFLRRILQSRPELQTAISISKTLSKKSKEATAIIGLVTEKTVTKNGNLFVEIEDPTGKISVIVTKKRQDLFMKAKNLVLDEVVGVIGVSGDRSTIFVNNIFFPDIPLGKELKKSPDEAYAAFISDIHIGSNMFLPDHFSRFIDWLNGKVGNESQLAIAKKVKYLFIMGDIVDGVGIYPEQEKELKIKDIYEQYNECANYLGRVRKDIQIIICPGNHDALRISEPQPVLSRDFAKKIYELENVTVVSNPAYVKIHSSEDFPGFDVLMYHGFSFDYYVSNVDDIRNNGGYDRADLIMQFLLQKRHLAPTHASSLYIPDPRRDPLVISKVPDFFVTGHIHKANISYYKNVTMICGSCWQAKTTFQEKVGHNPEPAKVPIVNLKTREARMMRF